MTVIGLLWMRFRVLYLLLAAEGGVRLRPYLGPEKDRLRGIKPSFLAHSSWALLFLFGEQLDGLSGVSGEGSDLDLWNLGSVFLSISAADMRALASDRLPFFSSRALKLSLLVLLLRTLLWIDPTCFGEARLGAALVGVTGGEGEWFRAWSSSESLRPRTFLLDLRVSDIKRKVNSPWTPGFQPQPPAYLTTHSGPRALFLPREPLNIRAKAVRRTAPCAQGPSVITTCGHSSLSSALPGLF